MKCPCEDCLCVPICRHKRYITLNQCSILSKYLIEPYDPDKRPPERIRKLKKTLQPTNWRYINKDNFGKNVLWITFRKDGIYGY